MKGVKIDIYIESSIIYSHYQNEIKKRINPIAFYPKPPIRTTQGYDRRAELLNYTHKLRSANSKPSQGSSNKSLRKQQKVHNLFSSFLFQTKELNKFYVGS